jgi:hypothetical protein
MFRVPRFGLISAIALIAALVPHGGLAATQSSSTAMVAAGQALVNALTPQQRPQAMFPLESDDLFTWKVVPDSAASCTGLALEAMTPAQRTLAQHLLQAGLSDKGYATYTAIMNLEDVLRGMDKDRKTSTHDPLAYCVSIFGNPAPDTDWAWRVEGPHVSLHFTVVKGRLASSAPTFAGANPAEVRSGKEKGTRVLAEQEDAARAMLMALTPEERTKAIVDTTAPGELLTANMETVSPMKPAGLPSKDMTPEQRLQLIGVVKTYADLLADDLARERVDRIYSAGVDQLYFAWAGGTEPGQPHYYRIQGPTFVLELDNAQDAANHIHTVWRDFNGDFGRDLLRGHLQNPKDTKSTGTKDTKETAGSGAAAPAKTAAR